MTTTMTPPQVGQAAPDFKLKGPGGAFYTLSEYRGEKNVLLAFYPLAFSPVCSHQLPEIQKALERFQAADTEVFGISVDSHHANAAFAASLGLGFPLLSDWNREASTAYGVLMPGPNYSGRALFAIDKQGTLVFREISDNVSDIDKIPSFENALAALKG